jgi:hypothetical protein
MTTPGTVVTVTTTNSANSTASSLGTAFFIGQAASGPVGKAVPITSLAQYVTIFGGRTFNGATATLYDAVDAFFQEGGALCYVSRVSGASAVVASVDLHDRAGSPLNTLKVSALGPGTYGNAITVAVANGVPANSYVLTITNGTVIETSPPCYSPADAVNWAANYSQTVVITNDGSATAAPNNNPAVVGATNLTGGTDDTSPADSQWVAALVPFTLDLGMGQVAAPGRTTQTVWQALVNHALANNRFALLDGENTATASAMVADVETIQASVPDPSWGIMLAAYPIYPGLATGTATPPYPRTVAPSGPIAGVMAALAATGANGDVAAAGQNGVLSHAIGVTQKYSDTDRGTLDAAGVGVIRQYKGAVQLYGYTSMAVDTSWSDVGNCRLRMQIIDGVRNIGDGFEFADIDAQGQTASAFGGLITSFLDSLYIAKALFGATAADAFSVNVGPSVNTQATAAARQLDAQVAVRMAATAEQVIIDVTRVPVNQTIPG